MIALETLQTVWYVLLAFMLAMFVVLDGYDLGTGMWYLLARRGPERTQLLTTIAPFWDGNQVWLVAAGGAAFAAFPPVYAALLSGLYPLLIVLLVALILRTVAVEYAQKEHRPVPRQRWDLTFALSSTVAVAALGLLLGNILDGLPLDAQGELRLPMSRLFNPLALLVTVLLLLLVALQGSNWLALKTTDEVRRRARRWSVRTWLVTFPLLLIAYGLIALTTQRLLINYERLPGLWSVPILAVLTCLVSGSAAFGRREVVAFAASSCSLLLFFGSSAVALYPALIPAHDAALSLTASNASASRLSLEVLLIVATLGLPAVLAYTAGVHWLFRERARPREDAE